MAKRKLPDNQKKAIRREIAEKLKTGIPPIDVASELAKKHGVPFQLIYKEITTTSANRDSLGDDRHRRAERHERVVRTLQKWAKLDRVSRVRGLVTAAERLALGASGEDVLRKSEAIGQSALAWCDRPDEDRARAAADASSTGETLRSEFAALESAEPRDEMPEGAGDAAWDAWGFRGRARATAWALGRVALDLRIAAAQLAAREGVDAPPSFAALCENDTLDVGGQLEDLLI
jgi:hypothetical protein